MGLRKSRLFTEGELDFMKVLWVLGEASPEEIQKALQRFSRKLTGGTIRNVLVVMIEKGYVTRRKKGKVYLYKAKMPENQAKKFMIQDLLEKAFNGSESHMVATLLKTREVRKEEMEEIEQIPEIEREEIVIALEKKGFTGDDLERATNVIVSDKDVWADTMMLDEHGLTLESTEKPLIHGLMTFLSFVVFGSIPLIPYVIGIERSNRFSFAIWSTLAALIVLGLTRSIVTRERLFRGPIEIVSVGAIGAIFAYGIGVLLKDVVGIVL